MSAPAIATRISTNVTPPATPIGPFAQGLLAVAFGWPFRSLHESANVSANTTSNWTVGATQWGGGLSVTTKPSIGQPGQNFHLNRRWQFQNDPSTLTLFAAIHLTSTSASGQVCGIGPLADAGIHMGIGSGDFDTLGNRVQLLYGGLAWFGGNADIGTGSHTIAITATPGSLTGNMFVDGVRRSSFSPGNANNNANLSFFHVGNVTGRSGGNGHITSAVTVAVAAAWNRALSENEIAILHGDPLAMIRR